jgi:hypothetical protein
MILSETIFFISAITSNLFALRDRRKLPFSRDFNTSNGGNIVIVLNGLSR